MKKQEECRCNLVMRRKGYLYVHLMNCPEGYTVKDYDKLPWYKKLLRGNPRNLPS